MSHCLLIVFVCFQRMEEMLNGFQCDLSSISSEIQTLQSQSVAMNVKLKNRQAVRGELSQFVDEMVVPEAMIKWDNNPVKIHRAVFQTHQNCNPPAGRATMESCPPALKKYVRTRVYLYEQCVKSGYWLCFTKMVVSRLIMFWFETFKVWYTQWNRPVLQGGLDAISVRPHTFLFVLGGRMGIILNTA